ncbi:hypothetical protein KAFR_0B06460 [Kazachstania africana CBS 2517]|uniref:Phosphoinositide phospholipase C n=1 Tax=Kazachstania africana (strain ATCC 22294 / BCRC 22015 / CBS 2517 / CECT 1963 / NBRC 1671 / NRRL Y-8276) TaxID=1071382 RepID=H2ARE2_KAZAF|nr:hypothetical protein KAFR_0B06460 [Kazachstania africana CBS 2517]CCF56942.1 hypothetical protein KAFR_0B06460 [Kazachstania africana CBS 2517]
MDSSSKNLDTSVVPHLHEVHPSKVIEGSRGYGRTTLNTSAAKCGAQTAKNVRKILSGTSEVYPSTNTIGPPVKTPIVKENKNRSYLQSFPIIGPSTYPYSLSEILKYASESTSKITLIQDEGLLKMCKLLRKEGVFLIKITRNKRRKYLFKLDDDNSVVTWRSDKKKKLELDSIKDIRVGTMANNYFDEHDMSPALNNLWITLIYSVGRKLKVLHLLAPDSNAHNIFFNCIYGLVTVRRRIMESLLLPDNEEFARVHWRLAVSELEEDEGKDVLTFDQIRKLCSNFQIYCTSEHLLRLFKNADVNRNQLLNFKEFQAFVKSLKRRKEIDTIWNSLIKDQEFLDFDSFCNFLVDIQGEIHLKRDEIKTIFRDFKETERIGMTKGDFVRYLNSRPYLTSAKERNIDYTRPLNHYFIASSHNTYLLGKQYGETPSVEGYIQVLQQGCRSVEIDIWDDNSGPVVCHGILTPAIPLANVIKVIRKYAFISSYMPLIISLEMHCNKENQKAVAIILKDLLGDLLYTNESTELGDMPSPMELRHKIVLKVKKSKSYFQSSNNSSFSSSSSYYSSSYFSSNDSEIDSTNMIAISSTSKPKGLRRLKRIGSLKKRADVIPVLLDISSIYGLKFRNFSLPESKTVNHCFSLNEKKVDFMIKDSVLSCSLNKHNRKYLMRVYPHVLRYKSSNFNPIKYWKLGVQMVATNWQTNDIGQQLNLAMFQLEDTRNSMMNSGYILKPRNLIDSVSKIKDITSIYNSDDRRPVKLRMRVVSGQLLPHVTKLSINKNEIKGNDCGSHTFAPYVVARVIDDEESIVKPLFDVRNGTQLGANEIMTSTCQGNGFNPIFEMEFQIILRNLDFSFLQLVVKTNESSIGTAYLKLEYLKKGYRHIPLFNSEGQRYTFSTLFIYSELTEIDY